MNLQESYNSISKEFSSTRHTKWPCVTKFYDDYVERNSYILDAGCGNGKNIIDAYIFEACDITETLLDIVAETKAAGIVQSTVQTLPYVSNIFDNAISIAVIHHLNTFELRKQAITDIVRCVKPGGTILITNWAYENNKFETQDCFVPFKNPKGDILAQRYYHLFTENELPDIVNEINNCDIVEYYNEHKNWIGVIKKHI
jgi:SAM-dependent methyltransferase